MSAVHLGLVHPSKRTELCPKDIHCGFVGSIPALAVEFL